MNGTGLLAALLGIISDRLQVEGLLAEALLENFVMMELRKQSAWSDAQPELFYWRTASGQEVDIVLEDRAGRLAGIEVKAAATLGAQDVRGLQAMATAAGKSWGSERRALHRCGGRSLRRQSACGFHLAAVVGITSLDQVRSTASSLAPAQGLAQQLRHQLTRA